MVKAVPFHSQDYWQSRFENEQHFEWLTSWPTLEPLITPYLAVDEPILHIGCGNSTLAFDLADRGYSRVINVDYAANVISQMEEQTDRLRYPHIEWHAADCLAGLCAFDKETKGFTTVIDKSLVDAIACGDTVDLAAQRQLADHVLSVTRPGGVWLSISFSSEREYVSDAARDGWTWHCEKTIPIEQKQSSSPLNAPAIYHWIYVLRKVPS
ncbi:S-adenosyl-L-methionine-dependent methyltransferase [Dichotomocladium elegans]|nr:S-adenosyl-L-methionine-dependent methyltransferase [Dichotomocladium elegans]